MTHSMAATLEKWATGAGGARLMTSTTMMVSEMMSLIAFVKIMLTAKP